MRAPDGAEAGPLVVVAPDSFKGTLSAGQVAEAMAAGVRSAGGRAMVLPLADGGEGTLETLASALGGDRRLIEVAGPLGERVTAPLLLIGGPGGGTGAGETVAVVETASAAGLTLVPADRRDAERASTYGVGQLLVAAARLGARRILLGAGGSATTDGGAGALAAIEGAGGLGSARIEVLCDVQTPFEQAAIVFGPQKGADDAAVRRLTDRLAQLARRLPRDPTGVPRTGAAGGLSGGLWAQCDARLVSGIDTVLDVLAMDGALAGAAAVLTGEGRLDRQSLAGKAIAGLARRARAAGVPLHAVVGGNELTATELAELGVASVTEAGDPTAIEEAARRCVARIGAG